MSKQLTVLLGLSITLIAMVLVTASCSTRQERQPVAVQVSCAKTEGVPMHAKSGGEGEVRETLSQGDEVTVLRSKEGWSLVRLKGNRRSGWIESSRLGKCPAGGTQSGKAPAKAPAEAPAKAPVKAPE